MLWLPAGPPPHLPISAVARPSPEAPPVTTAFPLRSSMGPSSGAILAAAQDVVAPRRPTPTSADIGGGAPEPGGAAGHHCIHVAKLHGSLLGRHSSSRPGCCGSPPAHPHICRLV